MDYKKFPNPPLNPNEGEKKCWKCKDWEGDCECCKCEDGGCDRCIEYAQETEYRWLQGFGSWCWDD